MTTSTSTTNEKMMARIQGLLDKAASTGHDAERDALIGKAEELMTKYAISQALLAERASKGLTDLKPEEITARKFDIPGSHADLLSRMLNVVARSNRCQVIVTSTKYAMSTMEEGWTCEVIGFPSDIEFSLMTYTSLFLYSLRKIDPAIDPEKSVQENIYLQKAAGVRWEDIARKINESPLESTIPWPDGGRLKRAWHLECKERGEEPRTIYPRSYQNAFMDEYIRTVNARFINMEIKKQQKDGSSDKGALVLRNRALEVRDFTAKKYPKTTSVRGKNRTGGDALGRVNGRKAGQSADISGRDSKVSSAKFKEIN